jgi:hypothetical protein
VGVATVTATAVDNCGNASSCTFDVYVSCFAVNELKIEQKADRAKVELKGTMDPAEMIDVDAEDIPYIVDDGEGHIFSWLIPMESFAGKDKDKQAYEYKSDKGSVPEIKAKFKFGKKCEYQFEAKKVEGLDGITGTDITVTVLSGMTFDEEMHSENREKIDSPGETRIGFTRALEVRHTDFRYSVSLRYHERLPDNTLCSPGGYGGICPLFEFIRV